LGRKAKCPDCGKVIEFRGEPGGESQGEMTEAERALAALERGKAAAARAAGPATDAEEAEEAVAVGVQAASPMPRAVAAHATPSPKTSVTTIERMVARTSPYRSVRILAAICFAVGVALAILDFIGGLAALILVAMQGHPWIGVAAFVGALVLAGLMFLAGKVLSDLARLAADVGDETRRMTQWMEQHLNHSKDKPA
jgi:hypothetical protein